MTGQTSAECVEWWVCPYIEYEGEACTRALSIVDAGFASEWFEIEVEGTPVLTPRGQALVCMMGDETPPLGSGCREINRTEVRLLTQPPPKPYCDNGTLRFHDGRGGRALIRSLFNQRAIRRVTGRDSAFEDGILQERNR